jgi:uncharacterized protein
MFDTKVKDLYRLIDSFPKVLIAYSGGVDSACLLRIAYERLGDRALGIIADSPSLPREELQEALALAKNFGARVEVIQTEEFKNPDYLSNPTNRCYFCKHALFEKMEMIAQEKGFPILAYGENADDALQVRPGVQAAKEFQVRAPLKEAGLTKADVRQLSIQLALPTADKPASPCLSSRIPHGTPVTLGALAQIEKGESELRKLGFRVFRLRHHGIRARLEFASDEVSRASDPALREKILSCVRQAGYEEIEIDPAGYRSPSAVIAA